MPAAACAYCGKPTASGTRCLSCQKKDAAREEKKRSRRKAQKLCPQCGKVKLAEGEKSCLRCMLKVKDEDDFVDPIMKSRNWKKRLSGSGTDSKEAEGLDAQGKRSGQRSRLTS